MAGGAMKNKIDVISFLEDSKVEFTTSGKNTTRGWVNVHCPYPSCSDPSFHCGINLHTGFHHCWICGGKGNMFTFIMTLFSCSYAKASRLLQPYGNFINLEPRNDPRLNTNVKPIDLHGFDSILPDIAINYLLNRGFNPAEIVKKYKILYCHFKKPFAYRIIVPIILDDKIVNLTGRDITGTQDPKYKNLSNEEAVIPMKDCLYNLDTVKKTVVICEGVTDVWKIGDGSVATMGVEYTPAQLNLLLERNIQNAYVLYDLDAIVKAEKLCNALSAFIPNVEMNFLCDHNDPGELTEEEALNLRKEYNL